MHYDLLRELWADITLHIEITHGRMLVPVTDGVDVQSSHIAPGENNVRCTRCADNAQVLRQAMIMRLWNLGIPREDSGMPERRRHQV